MQLGGQFRRLLLAEFLPQFFQRLTFADEFDGLDVRNRFQLALQRRYFALGRIGKEADLDVEFVADLTALCLRRLKDRDQDPEQDDGDNGGHDRGHARRPVAAQRSERLLGEEEKS